MKSSRSETLILSLTFGAAILTDLDIHILVGVLTSLFVFLLRSVRLHVAAMAPVLTNGRRHLRSVLLYQLDQCPEISFLRIEGPLFFASTEFVEQRFRRFEALFPGRRIKILALKGLGEIDLAGADFICDEVRAARAGGGDFHVVAAHIGTVRALRRLGVIDVLRDANLHPTKAEAFAAAVEQADGDVCKTCRVRVFLECANMPRPPGELGTGEPRIMEDVYEGFDDGPAAALSRFNLIRPMPW